MMSTRIFFVMLIASLGTISSAQEGTELDWDALQKTKPWHKSEVWDPIPEKVTPGFLTAPPSDAIVLFDGTDLGAWHKPKFDYGAWIV